MPELFLLGKIPPVHIPWKVPGGNLLVLQPQGAIFGPHNWNGICLVLLILKGSNVDLYKTGLLGPFSLTPICNEFLPYPYRPLCLVNLIINTTQPLKSKWSQVGIWLQVWLMELRPKTNCNHSRFFKSWKCLKTTHGGSKLFKEQMSLLECPYM